MPLRLSSRAQSMRTSPIRSMTVECARVGGINLAQGICDTPVPEDVRRAAQAAIDEGQNIYSRADGLYELRAALAGKMKRHNDLDYDPEGEVIVTSGATGAFFAAVWALLDPGDEVILLDPYYGYHLNTLEALGMGAVHVPLGVGGSLDLDRLEASITERTRGIVVNTPGNPHGRVFDLSELGALADLVARRDLVAFTDEVYEHFVFDGHRHISLATLPGMRERTVTMNALSKTFAITGWRIGWLGVDRRFGEAFAALHDLVYVCAPTPLQMGCARGLETLPESYYAGIGPEYQQKRDQLCAALAQAGLPPIVPEGSYFAMADLSRLPGRDSEARCRHLLAETGVAAVPGSAFYPGSHGDGVARFCFGKVAQELDEACRRLRALG